MAKNQYRGAKTWEQLLTKKGMAARFARQILKDEAKANKIENETVEEYAERKKIRVKNPEKGVIMAKIQELKDGILEAVVELDQADGSRTGMTVAIDNARIALANVYGEHFERDVENLIESQDEDEDDSIDDIDNIDEDDEE